MNRTDKVATKLMNRVDSNGFCWLTAKQVSWLRSTFLAETNDTAKYGTGSSGMSGFLRDDNDEIIGTWETSRLMPNGCAVFSIKNKEQWEAERTALHAEYEQSRINRETTAALLAHQDEVYAFWRMMRETFSE